jgi:hypothetical protein
MGKTGFTYRFILAKSLKIVFSKINRPISITFDKSHPCMEGIQDCSDIRPERLQRGYDHKNAKLGWGVLIFVLKNC